MDIAFNKPLDYQTLHAFLQAHLSESNFFLLYDGKNGWDGVPEGLAIFQYLVDGEKEGPFKYGLSLFTDHTEPLPYIEHLAHALARAFDCSALCDASRVVLKEKNAIYSLLFEGGQVYLVDDYDFEESGEVTKIVALNYKLPALSDQ